MQGGEKRPRATVRAWQHPTDGAAVPLQYHRYIGSVDPRAAAKTGRHLLPAAVPRPPLGAAAVRAGSAGRVAQRPGTALRRHAAHAARVRHARGGRLNYFASPVIGASGLWNCR